MLRRFNAGVTEKVADFENIARGVIDETACIAAELITRLGSILDPLADPSRVLAVNRISALCCRSARNNVVVGRQVAESHQLFEDAVRNRNPALAALRIKVFHWAFANF